MLSSQHAEWYGVAGHRSGGRGRERGRERERKEGSSRLASKLYLCYEQYLRRRERGRDRKTEEGEKKGSESKGEGGKRREETHRREPTSSDRLRRYSSKNISTLRR